MYVIGEVESSLITSQIDTAPKHTCGLGSGFLGLITSQIDTAPKRDRVQRQRR